MDVVMDEEEKSWRGSEENTPGQTYQLLLVDIEQAGFAWYSTRRYELRLGEMGK